MSSGGLEPSVIRNHIPPTSLTCNVESKVAEDYWELDLIWFVVPSYLKTRLEHSDCGFVVLGACTHHHSVCGAVLWLWLRCVDVSDDKHIHPNI